MLHAVIMAGGAGTRFWPASRVDFPKQLLDLTGGRTMIQATVDRLGDLVPPARTMIVTNQRLVGPIGKQLPDVPPELIVGEPCKRDTAPCVGLAASWLLKQDPQATMVVMPADHVISPDSVFQDAIRHAAELVEQASDRLVTFGIRPSYPAETFGYIERGPLIKTSDKAPLTYSVKQFKEKPPVDVARQYLAAGTFYWNSGIFVWKAQTIMDQLEAHQPEMYAHLMTIADAVGTDAFHQVFPTSFAAIQGTSIDYAVMEKAKEVLVVEAPFGWDDVGNWPSLARLNGTDEHGNTFIGKHLALDTHDTIVRTDDDHLIVTLGIKNCIVVHTPDATLVADKQQEASIRQVVQIMTQRGWERYL